MPEAILKSLGRWSSSAYTAYVRTLASDLAVWSQVLAEGPLTFMNSTETAGILCEVALLYFIVCTRCNTIPLSTLLSFRAVWGLGGGGGGQRLGLLC